MSELGKLTSKGQITVPKKIRDAVGLRSGDLVKFQVRRGKVEMAPTRRPGWSAGFFAHKALKGRKAPTVEEMNEAIAQGMAARFKRSRS